MSKAKRKHKVAKSNLKDLDFLLDAFAVVVSRLSVHPDLHPTIHNCLVETINDISGHFNTTTADWAEGNRLSLMRALHNAHSQRENSNG